MESMYLAASLFLLLNLVIGLARVYRGPAPLTACSALCCSGPLP